VRGNNIPQEQLTQKQLDRLAAQRQLYSDAKQLLAIQVVLAVPCVITWSVLAACIPALKIYAASWGIIVTLLDILLFLPWQKSLRQQAAKVQELFDCHVLQIPWRELKAGSKPDAEAIMASSSKFKCTDPECSTLRDWYPVQVSILPIHLARIACQRANCWWDAQLRRQYAVFVVSTVVLLTIVVLFIGLIGGLTLEDFFLIVLAPLIPAFVLGLRQYTEHVEAAGARDRLKEYAEKLWRRAIEEKISPEQLVKDCRDLQDEIYDHRRRSPFIFNWIYNRLKKSYEDRMNKGADTLIEEALTSISKTS